MNGQFKNETLWQLYKSSSDLTHLLTQIAFHTYDDGEYAQQIKKVNARLTDMGIFAHVLENQGGHEDD